MTIISNQTHGTIESIPEEDRGTVIRTEHRFNPHKEEDRQEYIKAKNLPGRFIDLPLMVLLRNHSGRVREVYSTIEHSTYNGGENQYKFYKPGAQFP